jgi:hypothetical protein
MRQEAFSSIPLIHNFLLPLKPNFMADEFKDDSVKLYLTY